MSGSIADTPSGGGDGGDGPKSIHDIVMVKEEGLSRRLYDDDHERRSGLVRFLAPDVTPALASHTTRATSAGSVGSCTDSTTSETIRVSPVTRAPGTVSCTIGTGGQLFAPVSAPVHDPEARGLLALIDAHLPK